MYCQLVSWSIVLIVELIILNDQIMKKKRLTRKLELKKVSVGNFKSIQGGNHTSVTVEASQDTRCTETLPGDSRGCDLPPNTETCQYGTNAINCETPNSNSFYIATSL